MKRVARLTDTALGECKECKTKRVGMIISGSPIVKSNTLNTVKVGDIVKASCGHIGIVDKGSTSANIEEKEVARVGDTFSGIFQGYIVSGSTNIKFGD